MKVYIGHSSSFDFRTNLYLVIRELSVPGCEFILPHEQSDEPTNSKENMKSIDLMIAEVSYPSTGLGIEMGWADALGKPIVAIYKSGTTPSLAVQSVCRKMVEYTDPVDLKRVVESLVKKYQ